MNFIYASDRRSAGDTTAAPRHHHQAQWSRLRLCTLPLLVLLGLFALWPTPLQATPRAATAVTGPITSDTTWTKVNSPYQITGSFTLVPQGRTLTIEAGVEVIFPNTVQFINGRLIANGSAAAPILFTSTNKTPGSWGGLSVQSGSSGPRAAVVLNHVITEFGGWTNSTTSGQFQVVNADATLTNVTVRNGGANGVMLTLASQISISDSTLVGNRLHAIWVDSATAAGSANFQRLSASGNGTNAITYENLFTRTPYTLENAGLPYILEGLTVDKTGQLTIAPGAQLRLQGAPIVRGELMALGTTEAPITFTSVNGVAGSWGGLQIVGDTQQLAKATLAHVVLEHGGAAVGDNANLKVATAVVTVTNSLVRNGGKDGILVQSNLTNAQHGLTVIDTEISGHPGGAIRLWDAMTDPTLRNLNLHDNGLNAIIHMGGLRGEHHWVNLGVPRIIRDLFTLNPQSKLIIDPGVQIRFEQNAAFEIQGELQAVGTKAQPIVFTGTQAQVGWWRSIRALAHTSILNLRYCEVAYGGAPWVGFANAMVHLGANGGVVQHCHLHHSGRTGLYVNLQSRPLVQYNRFEANPFGLQTDVTSVLPVDARNNWWGDPSGPTHASNPSGRGNTVSDKVLFKPWLTDPNNTGEVVGKLVLNVVGPRQFAPGATQLYTVHYANRTDQVLRNSVLRVLLPGYGEYIEHSGEATRWPQRHEVFWKLGELGPNAEGLVTVRVRFERGLPGTLRDGIVAQLSASNLANKPFDEAPYLTYVSPFPAVVRALSVAEVDAERAAHPALAQHYDQAVAAGYRFGSALTRRYNTGKTETQLTLLRTRPTIKVYFIWRHDDKVTGGELDGSGFTVRRGVQSIHFDVASGEWGAVKTEVSAADATIDWSECMKNCIIEKLPGNLLEKASTVFNITVKVIDCIKAVQGDESSILGCAKALEKVIPGIGEGIDLGQCNADCNACNGTCTDDKCHCCTQDKLSCDNSDWLYGALGISVKKRMPCDKETGRYLATQVFETCALCERCVQNGNGLACVRNDTPLNGTDGLAISQAPDGEDATATTCEVCRPARDPNDIVGPTGDLLPGQVVTYTINYENVGPGDALDVFIVNQLSQHFDPATLRFNSNNAVYSPYTHAIYWTVGDLTPKGQPGSKGAVTYSVRLKADLRSSTVISNSAVVHFPSVPEETPTNVVSNLIKPLAATQQSLTTNAGQPVNFTLRGRDIQGAPLTFALVEAPRYGRLTGNLPALTYVPGDSFAGEDRVVFTVNNGVATSSPADVLITVNPSAADRVAPQVLGTTPADQGTALVSTVELPAPGGPFYAPRLVATFSEALDPATVTANAVIVSSNGQTIPSTVRYNATAGQIEILLRTPLQVNRLYQVTVQPTVADQAGNRLAAAYTWRFTAVNEVAEPTSVTLTVQINPQNGGTVTGQGINCGTDCTEGYAAGTQVALTATPATGFQFTGWSNGCTGMAACTVLMDSRKTVIANFVPVNNTNQLLYLSSSKNGKVGSLKYSDEDILAFDPITGQWQLIWDGSDVKVKGDLDDFALLADGSLLLSFENPTAVAGISGKVDDSDLVRFVPTTLGQSTAGRFELYFDGSDVGLTTNNEDIDAFAQLADGALLISTRGSASVTGATGGNADLLRFAPTSLGANTAGSWSLYFRGQDVGFDQKSESIRSVWVASDGKLYLTSDGNFSLAGGFTGDSNDVFICTPTNLGTPTACTFSRAWDGAAVGFTGLIDGFDQAPVLGSVTAMTEMLEEVAESDESDLVDDNDVLDDTEPAEEAALSNQLFLPIITR